MSAGAELSSITTMLEGISGRIADMAESLSASRRDDLATTLFEAERSLETARRRLGQVLEQLS